MDGGRVAAAPLLAMAPRLRSGPRAVAATVGQAIAFLFGYLGLGRLQPHPSMLIAFLSSFIAAGQESEFVRMAGGLRRG